MSPIAGQAVRAGVILNGLAIALAFIAYRFDYGVSSVPGKISVAIAVICIAVPVLCWLACGSTRKFAMHGSVRLIGLLSVYALFGIAFYFFYFIFAPMPLFERILGLGGGGALSATSGVLFFIAAASFPVSLWLIGVMVRIGVTMIQLPLSMERKYHKPVLIAVDAPF